MKRAIIIVATLILPGPGALAQASPVIASANKAALHEPLPSAYMQAVQIYPFADGAIYRLYTAPGRVSEITLEAGESLHAIAAGDTVRWTVGEASSGHGASRRTHVLVKPFAAGLATNLVITTDRRVYHVQLSSTASAAMTSIRWTYPQDELLALARAREAERAAAPVSSGVAVEHLDFGYKISGDHPSWRPLRVFDDGRQTWIEFPPSIAVGEAPPFFVLGDDGEVALVNYRMAGRYYVVDRLFEGAELRLGGKRQQVVRIERSAQRKRAGKGGS